MDDFTHERADLDEVTTELSVVVPQEIYGKRITSEVQKLVSHVTIKGFRKGKAPAAMVKKIHGDRVRGEVTQRLVSETLFKALEKESISETIGDPEFSIDSNDEAEDLKYRAKVFFPPRPKITGYDSFEIKIEEKTVTDEDVDKAIKELLSSQATMKKVESRDVVQADDVIHGKITVSVDGGDPGAEEPLVVKLGEGQVPEDLESGILGMKIGETKDITTKIPDSHKDEELRGKEALYRVVIDEIQEQELPELTDDFVKTLGFGVETVLELRLKVREQLEAQHQSAESTEIHAEILKALLDENTFSVPQNLIDGEIRALLVRNGLVDPQKVDVARLPVNQFREQIGPAAEERVKTTVIIDQIIEQEKIEFGDDEIKEALTEISEQHGIALPEVEKILLGEGRKEGFVREHKQKKALDMLQERAKVKKVKAKAEAKAETKAKAKSKTESEEKKG